MESTDGIRLRGNNREKTNRRVWSYKEEKVLISTLKDFCRTGWKSETGVFKAGYIIALEKALLKAFPNTDLRASPHIESKLHVWKKHYTILASMLATDGFTWNDSVSQIVVEDENALQAFMRAHPKLYDVNMTHKTFPYYKDWKDIFGKVKPTDCLALVPHTLEDPAEEEVGNEEHEAGNFMDVSTSVTETPPDHENDPLKQKSKETPNEDRNFFDGSTSVTETRPNYEKDPTTKRKSKKMRLSPYQTTTDVASLSASLQVLTEKIEEGLGMIAQRLGHDQDVASTRRKLYPALGKLPGLQIEDKLKAADRIARDPHRIDIFFSLPDEDKKKMVKMLLDGRM